jgi:hypothetical protein
MQKPVLLTLPFALAKEIVSAHEVKKSMESFFIEHHDMYMRFPGCRNCISEKEVNYCSIKVNTVHDDILFEAFSRLFNTIRLNKVLMFDAFLDFQLSCKRNPAYLKEKSDYCIFLELLEQELKRRGEYFLWSHEDVDKAISLASSVMSKLTLNYSKVEKKNIESACSKELIAVSNLFKRLCKLDVLPFPGCKFCHDPCFYRYDIHRLGQGLIANDFRSAFMDSKIKMTELARVSWNATSQAFFAKDIRSRRGAALCFAIKQFSEMGLSRGNQEDMTDQITEALGSFKGN